MSNTKPTVKRSVLASAEFVAALRPVCSYMELGDVKLLANKIEAVVDHARRKHERDFGECDHCNRNVEFIHNLPPQVSAVALENPLRRTLRTPFTSLIFHSAMATEGNRRSKRGEQDFFATARLFAQHKKQHPELYKR